jgi:uncharacterized protein
MCRRVPFRILLPLVFLVLASGCSSTRQADHRLLARHPIHETRMSDQAEEGYVPAGVWRIRGVQNTVYLVGTSHIVPEDQVPFPSPFYAAYRDSEIVYIEFDTDLSWFTQLRLMPRMWRWAKSHRDVLSAPRDKILADYLSVETLDQLGARYGRDFRRERMTPISLLFMHELGLLETDREMPAGVETPFQLMARHDRKPLRELDDGKVLNTAFLLLDQMILGFEREISRHGADAAVREALLGGAKDDHAIWRHGDLAAVAQLLEEMEHDFPSIYEKALPERNRKWMREMKKLLRGRKNAMVMVGVAHVGGDAGLLNLLREAGFPAEQMYGVDRPGTTRETGRR